MKRSLLDIQKEIRGLENKVKDISMTVSNIYGEIEELRDDNVKDIDYKMIRIMSSHLHFGEHPLAKLKEEYACRLYIESLLNLIQVDCDSACTINRLTFVQWIINQSLLDSNLEELFQKSVKGTVDSFFEINEVLPKHYRKQLILDLLIIANICGQANGEVLVYVANLCSILDVDKEEVRILSIIAVGFLKQDFSEIKKVDLKQILKQSKEFKHYLCDDLCQSILCAQRKVVVKIADKSCRGFKWCVKQQARVNEGDVIADYFFVDRHKQCMSSGNTFTTIETPYAGTLFQFRDSCINYGVISDETDNKASIKAWVIERR